ncbi:uncharacterized protein LOC132403935 [Hypanus sabinus]|uniref:uncharacterized protein LOC132403935 n=1 Tax=Hypanus sabinus TaxID=79690 RepID=UPI0028C423EC|nr:uncharacterized protein LOC132403935 [Hypanus sabinus]
MYGDKLKVVQKEKVGNKCQTYLKVLYLNARSIRNKIDELTVQIITYGYDIVAITETWLQGDQDWELDIQGYSTIRRDRQEGKGGGVAMLIKQGITAIKRNDIGSKDQDNETIWVEIRNSKGKKAVVGVVYRPPNSCNSVGRSINQEIVGACNKGTAIIMGDFNSHIDWTNQVGHGSLEEEFIECIRDGFLEQYVTEPTRGQAVLDLVPCNETELLKNVLVKDPLGMSDHNMVEFHIQLEDERVGSQTSVLSLNKGDYDGMRAELLKMDWENKLKGRSVLDQWCIFKELFYNYQEKYIPLKKKGCKRNNSYLWLSKEIKQSIRLKRKLYKVAKSTGKIED